MSDDDESLTWPMALEIFRDRLYERAATTRSINAHGTSPSTREVPDVNPLQSDDEMRKKAANNN